MTFIGSSSDFLSPSNVSTSSVCQHVRCHLLLCHHPIVTLPLRIVSPRHITCVTVLVVMSPSVFHTNVYIYTTVSRVTSYLQPMCHHFVSPCLVLCVSTESVTLSPLPKYMSPCHVILIQYVCSKLQTTSTTVTSRLQ